jgi:hypothetical protein
MLMLENAFTLPRHSERNASLADSIGKHSYSCSLDLGS